MWYGRDCMVLNVHFLEYIFYIWIKKKTYVFLIRRHFKMAYHNYLCIRCTIFPDFSSQKLGVRIIHNNFEINFLPATCLTIFRVEWAKICDICSLNWNILRHYREISLECVFVYIFFFFCELIFAASLMYFLWIWVFFEICEYFVFSENVNYIKPYF